MSYLAEPEKEQCPRFLSGRWCFQQKKCGLIHDKSIMKAAKNQKRSKKDQHDHRGPRVMSYVQQLNDIEAGVLPGKNETLKGPQYGGMAHNEVIQNTSAIKKKILDLVKDGQQSSNPGKSQGYYGGKKASQSVNHANAATSANNTPETTQNALGFNLNQALPLLSSGQHAGLPSVSTIRSIIRPEINFANNIPDTAQIAHGFNSDQSFPLLSSGQHPNLLRSMSTIRSIIRPEINSFNNPETSQNIPGFNLYQPFPYWNSGQFAGLPNMSTASSMIHPTFNLSTPSTITYATPSFHVGFRSEKYGVKHRFNGGDCQIGGFSRKELEMIKFKNVYEDPAEQAAKYRMLNYGGLGQELSLYDVVGQELSLHNIMERKPLEVFTVFHELPFEIRLVIWQIAIHFPYNPTVQLQPVRDNNGAIVVRDLICQSVTPIVLRINQESRKEALKYFTLVLGNTTYLNKASGTVFFDGNEPGDFVHFVAVTPRREFQTIKHIAVHLSEWIWEETFKDSMWEFSNIKQLVMMFSRSDDNYYLRKEALKLIRKELKQPPENHSGWKVPSIVLVSSNLIEDFLNQNTFA